MPPSRRPAAREVHRRDVLRRRRAAERRARPARLHRHVGGKPISVQGTGHGLPGSDDRLRGADPARRQEAAPRRHLRRAAAAPRARRHDRRALAPCRPTRPRCTSSRNEPHCPTASWELIHGAVHAAKELGQDMHVGPIVSSDLFYNPDEGQYERWSKRGVLAVEMEAAALFTVGALRGVEAGLPADGERHRRRGRVQAHLRRRAAAAVDRMTRVALATATVRPLATPSSSSTRRPTTAPPASAGRRSPAARRRGGSRATRSSPRLPATSATSPARPRSAARSCSSSSAATARSTRSRTASTISRSPRSPSSRAARAGTSSAPTAFPTSSTARSTSRATDTPVRSTSAAPSTAPGTAATPSPTSRTSPAPA